VSPKWPLSLNFPHQNPEYFSPIPNLCCFNETIFCCSIWQSVFAERPQKEQEFNYFLLCLVHVEEWSYRSKYSWLPHWNEGSGWLHSPAALPPGIQPPVPFP
jgi:hypothetical protein